MHCLCNAPTNLKDVREILRNDIQGQGHCDRARVEDREVRDDVVGAGEAARGDKGPSRHAQVSYERRGELLRPRPQLAIGESPGE